METFDLGQMIATIGVPGALVAGFVIFIMKGWLIPANTVKQLLEDRIAWKEAYEKQRAINAILTRALSKLSTQYGDAATHFFNSIQQDVERIETNEVDNNTEQSQQEGGS